MDKNSGTVAGRGEGLKGLVAKHDPQLYSPQGPVSGINGTYTIAFLGCSCGWNSSGEASKTEKWSEHVVRALEAAAPASTGPGTAGEIKHLAGQVDTLLAEELRLRTALERAGFLVHRELCGNLAHHPECRLITNALKGHAETCNSILFAGPMGECDCALATPSPQAPATTPVDEPKNDDRAYGCYTCGKQGLKKGQRVSLVYCNECDAKHIEEVRRAAATQEQPAGSGMDGIDPSHDWRNILGLLKSTIGLCSDEEPHHQVISANLWHAVHMIYVLYGGSPRKVGEDGALREALEELFELVESGELVRDVSRDGEGDWLRRMVKLTATLKKAQDALAPSRQGAGGK